jgi:hypothetical protein
LKARKPSSENGSGERNSQAQKAVGGLPRPAMSASTRSNPAASGSGSGRTTRSI